MSTNIISKIDEELVILQREVSTFKSAVEYLNGAKNTVNSAIDAVKEAEQYHLGKLREIDNSYERVKQLVETVHSLEAQINSVDFPVRLRSIESLLSEVVRDIEQTTKNTLVEIHKSAETISNIDFEKKFSNIQNLISGLTTATNLGLSETRKSLIDLDNTFKNSTSSLIESIHANGKEVLHHILSMKLDQKIEKIDLSISSLADSIQYLQLRIDDLETSRQKDLQILTEKIIVEMMTLRADTQIEITAVRKSLLTIGIITWVLNFLTLGILAYLTLFRG